MNVNRYGLGRNISADVKKLVRERCRFGCVMCGRIPYHYDHFLKPFANATWHDPEDIVLLCTEHHALKTAELIDNDDIALAWRERQREPGTFAFKLPATRSDFRVQWPGNEVRSRGPQFFVGGRPVLGLAVSEDPLQPVLLNGAFHDLAGREICRIEDNEILSESGSVGDFQLTRNRFLYKTPEGRVALYFQLSSRGMEIKHIAHVFQDAYIISGSGFLQVGNSMIGARLIDCKVESGGAAFVVASKGSRLTGDVIAPDNLPYDRYERCAFHGYEVGVEVA